MKKTEKRLKKEKSMYNNMYTHLKSQGVNCNLVEIPVTKTKKKDEDKKDKEEEISTPSFFIQGIHKTNKDFGFQILIHDTKKNKNENCQVQLLLQIEKDKYVCLEPQTNGQLIFMLENFQTGHITIQLEKIEKEKK